MHPLYNLRLLHSKHFSCSIHIRTLILDLTLYEMYQMWGRNILSINTGWHKKKGTFEMRSGSHVQLAALRNRDLELQTNFGLLSLKRQVIMVQFLSIFFFCWISSIFVGVFKSSRFFVSPCITEYVGWRSNASDFYFGCSCFDSWPGNWLSWEFLWFPSFTPGKCGKGTWSHEESSHC